MARTDHGEKQYHVGYHVVCVIDLLGQKGSLAEWAVMPPGDTVSQDMLVAIKRTAGTVLQFRDMFRRYFEEFEKPRIPESLLDTLPLDRRALYHRTRHAGLASQQFSDTFVFYARIGNDDGDETTIPLFGTIVACCWSMIASLAASVPFRGGLCIGVGMELSEQNFYGPALASAHYLENEVAQYPRVVVSEEVVDFVGRTNGYSSNPIIDSIMAKAASTCQSLLTRDYDDHMIVDFLGPGFKSVHDSMRIQGINLSTAVRSAHRNVVQETDRFSAAGDTKLADRYARLRQYIEDRLPLWL